MTFIMSFDRSALIIFHASLGWSTEKGSIADQLREAAHEALNEAEGKDSSQMVWCDDYQMYYDHNTQFYYTEV